MKLSVSAAVEQNSLHEPKKGVVDIFLKDSNYFF